MASFSFESVSAGHTLTHSPQLPSCLGKNELKKKKSLNLMVLTSRQGSAHPESEIMPISGNQPRKPLIHPHNQIILHPFWSECVCVCVSIKSTSEQTHLSLYKICKVSFNTFCCCFFNFMMQQELPAASPVNLSTSLSEGILKSEQTNERRRGLVVS